MAVCFQMRQLDSPLFLEKKRQTERHSVLASECLALHFEVLPRSVTHYCSCVSVELACLPSVERAGAG